MKTFFTWLVSSIVVWLRIEELKVIGGENLPGKDVAYIVVSTHQSYIDTAVIWKVTSRPLRLWMKTDIFFKYVDPPLVLLCRIIFGIIPVNRQIRGAGPITESVPLLKSGCCIAVYPSGSRKVEELSYKGVVQLAIDTGVPVIPLYLSGTSGGANPLNIIQRGRISVSVTIGKALLFTENGLPRKTQREQGLAKIAESFQTLKTSV